MIGIIGGVGPFAGLSLHQAILAFTNARKDQDHLPVIHINAASEIPDRTEYLLGKIQINPSEALVSQADKLIKCGATVIGIPCNTAHSPAIINPVQEFCNLHGVTLVNMIDETLKNVGNAIGLMATQGTYSTKIYHHYNTKYNKDIIVPEVNVQEIIHAMIYHPENGLKATGTFSDYARKHFEEALLVFEKKGIKNIILGCTELAVFIPVNDYNTFTFVNTINILAKQMISIYETRNT